MHVDELLGSWYFELLKSGKINGQWLSNESEGRCSFDVNGTDEPLYRFCYQEAVRGKSAA